MISGYYESIKIDNQRVIDSLTKVINAIDYDKSKVEKGMYDPNVTLDYAKQRVSEEALKELEGNRDVATYDCNLLKFNNINFDWVVPLIGSCVKVKALGLSGRIWYPENGYMGWHTNNDNQGFKLYCSFAKEGQKSFFRYRNPDTKEIVTSWDDQGWNFRVFKIQSELLWHCVYSETDRFSIGFTIVD